MILHSTHIALNLTNLRVHQLWIMEMASYNAKINHINHKVSLFHPKNR